jgi:quinol-cytochrome oxidoreductase complex cytochrome b subunit
MENQNTSQVTSVKDWAIRIFLASIPLVGLILLLVWAFGNDGNKERSNWAKGNLLIALIMIILWFLIIMPLFGMAFFSALSGANNY